jgi:hypothetical protein
MTGQRKLFIGHAGELAHRLVKAVGREGLVARFVCSYAEQYNRQGLLGDSIRMGELVSTIGREALLVMAADVYRRVPRAFASGPHGLQRPEEIALSEAFFAEFLTSLCRALISSTMEASAETEAFHRDLRMYQRWGQRATAFRRIDIAGPQGSPFPDRCALLLDPSMMETARRAAVDFESEVVRTEARVFARLGRRAVGRTKTTGKFRRARRPQRPAKRKRSRQKSSSPVRKPRRRNRRARRRRH